ncbi:Asp-tRNAAsn/Glu-tRNAGln amidotransferase A subunit [Raineyella antarctica]|uniref:Asp-tRNAAsn/Glu-tRNAGln amidotransferase A subunit n=2 Tax=Raineyella antarctica TaxID=1577474 RepID=A0A1G6GPW8_9ACTN|nr:Asp-tRNAAsn/Glu-tRNAGln amidotransferase A subunit [Raineyella antarctica]
MPSHDAGLAPMFRRFVDALEAGDVRLVERFFVPGDQTLLVRRGGMVVGFASIVEAVRADPLAPCGRLLQSHLREIGPDGTLVTATHRTATGGQGVMTLLWERTDEGWRIASAHVGEPDPAIDPAVWRQAGAPLAAATGSGPLEGMSVAAAELFPLAGHSLASLPVGADAPARTAEALAGLQQAGASVVGLARIDGLGLGDTGDDPAGMPRNARAAGRLPGGAMSGPTAAVALGQADLGLGLDTWGSLLLPASYQGLFGIRTTHGVVPLEGVAGVAPSFDSVGWVARDLAVLAEVADVLLPQAGLLGLDEALLGRDLLGLADPDVVRAIEAVLDRWDSSVLPMRMVGQDRDVLDGWAQTCRQIRDAEVAGRHRAGDADLAGLGADVRTAIRSGLAMDDARLRGARRAQAAARAATAELVGNGVLLLPTTATVAPVRDRAGATARRGRDRTQQLLSLATLGGLPTVTLPLATRRRLPCGLSLVGPLGSDHALLGLAGQLAAAGVIVHP